MPVLKLSQITAASSGFVTGDQIVSVKSGAIDALLSKAQLFAAPIVVTDIADPATSTLTLTGATALTTSQPVLNITQTWNNAAVGFTAIKLTVTNTNSAAASYLIDLSIGASPIFNVNKGGTINAAGGLTISSGGQINFNGSTLCGALSNGNFYIGNNTGANRFHLYAPSGVVAQLGQADAAAPVAQTLQVQSVVAGTSNTAGVDWTFVGSKGTGTGAGGNILFNLAPAGSTGTTQNAAVQVFAIKNPGTAAVGQPAIQIGSGNTTSQGWILGYFGTNATSGMWTTAAAPSQTNFVMYVDSYTRFNSPGSNGFVWYISNNQKMLLDNAGSIQLGSTFFNGTTSATFHIGAVDAAAPVAQTLQVQSVVAGTSNTAGADWTFVGSKGTGTGAGGKIIFKTTGGGGTSGTAQNTPLNAISIDNYPAFNTTRVTIGNQNINAAQLGLGGDVNTGLSKDSGQGISFWLSSNYSGGIGTFGGGGTGFVVPSTYLLGFASGTSVVTPADTALTRAAAASLQQGKADAAAPVAQTLQVQSVVAGSSNVAGVNWTFIGSKGTGTGAGGSIIFQTAPCSSGTGATAQNPVQTGLSITASSVATFTQQPSVVIGSSQLNSSAVEGFLYIPTVNGPPTGTPTTYTGRVPIVFDSSNNKLYIFNSSGAAWVGGTVPGAWS